MNFEKSGAAREHTDYIRLGRYGRKDRISVLPEKLISDDSGEYVNAGRCRKHLVLSTGREGGRRKKNGASMMPRLNGLVLRLGLFFAAVPVLDQSISSKKKLADFH